MVDPGLKVVEEVQPGLKEKENGQMATHSRGELLLPSASLSLLPQLPRSALLGFMKEALGYHLSGRSRKL